MISMRRLGGALLVILLSACADGEASTVTSSTSSTTTSTTAAPVAELPACNMLHVEGAPVDVAVLAQAEGCIDWPWTAKEDCPDGRVLHWNAHGWGLTGDAWHRFDRADGHQLPPDELLELCGDG